MININILDFLMENDIVLHSNNTNRFMTAQVFYNISGEFVVYNEKSSSFEEPLYYGLDFEKAVKIMNGDE